MMNHQYMHPSGDRTAPPIFTGDQFVPPMGPLGSTNSSPGGAFDDEANMLAKQPAWHPHIPMHPLPPTAPSSNASSVPTKSSAAPQQKRRRVTRACDECRRKKIKCDGKQSCSHCTIYSYECTYDQPSNRRRNPAPQQFERLESENQVLRKLLKTVGPQYDLDSHSFDLSKIPADFRSAVAQMAKVTGTQEPSHSSDSANKDPVLDSMVEASGQLDMDKLGNTVEFHGHSSGMTYLNHLNSQFGGILPEMRLGGVTHPVRAATDSPNPSSQSPQDNLPDVSLMPTKETADILVRTCLEKACVLMRFIHNPSFVRMVGRLYERRPEDYDDEDNTFLPLFYLSLAVGCLFINESELGGDGTCRVKVQGESIDSDAFKYFNAGRRMIELTDIRDVYSLQAVILMTVYLQSSTRMATCYSYVGIALSAAVRMGMHRAVTDKRFSPIDREVRKRIFWTCWKMDTYVGAILGLPKGIAPEDIDQEMPEEVNDDHITEDGITPMPPGKFSSMVAVNAHTRLLVVMAKTVKNIYPLKRVTENVSGRGGYSVSQMKVHEVEQDLARWLETLPQVLNSGEDVSRGILKCRYLLKMSFAHVQMMLYRPFVHYVDRSKSGTCDEGSYAIASACVNTARKIIRTTEEMRRLGLLNGAYWFTIYTTFFAIITLVYYSMFNPTDAVTQSIMADAKLGKDCLSSIQHKSAAANRCVSALVPLLDKASEKISSSSTSSKRKRPRASSQSAPQAGDINSPTISTPGTLSRDETQSPARRIKASSTESNDRSSNSWSVLDGSNSSAMAMNQRAPYEMYQTGPFDAKWSGPSSQQQPMTFQAQPPSTGVQSMNDLMPFDSEADVFAFSPRTRTKNQYSKEGSPINSPVYSSMPSGGIFGMLEGTILGRVTPYHMIGEQMAIDGLGNGDQPQVPQMDSRFSQSLSDPYFMTGNGIGGEFFSQEWV